MAASNNVSQQGQTVKWGTDASTTYGLIQTISQGAGGQQKEYRDFEGSTKTLVTYDRHETISMTAICIGSVTLPKMGDKVTVSVDGASKEFYVQSATLDWNNEDAARVTISGRTYPSLGTASA